MNKYLSIVLKIDKFNKMTIDKINFYVIILTKKINKNKIYFLIDNLKIYVIIVSMKKKLKIYKGAKMRELKFTNEELINHENILNIESYGKFQIKRAVINGNLLLLTAKGNDGKNYSITTNLVVEWYNTNIAEEIGFTAGQALGCEWTNLDIHEYPKFK